MKRKIYGHAECDKIHLHTKTQNRKEKKNEITATIIIALYYHF